MKYSKEQTQELLQKIENSLRDHLLKNKISDPIIIGVHTGGAWIAEWLQKKMGYEGKSASLNINFYRDDFSRAGVNPKVEPTEMPVSIDDKHIILVDDVLFTGRTTRAAINEIFDFEIRIHALDETDRYPSCRLRIQSIIKDFWKS